MKRPSVMALVLAGLLAGPGLCLPSRAENRSPEGESGAEVTFAPDFTRPDLAGHIHRLTDYRGKVVLLNFWATWCAPCLIEIPRFSGWQRQYGARGLQILGISMDDSSEPVSGVYRRYDMAYPVMMGDATLARLYGGVFGLPSTYLIDSSGRIVARYRGESDLAEMEGKIKALLPSPKP